MTPEEAQAWHAAVVAAVAPARVGGLYQADGAAWATTERAGWLVTLGSAGGGYRAALSASAAARTAAPPGA